MSGKKEWWDTGEFTFFRLPRAVIDNKKYAALSGDAKLLYALLVNRLSLSASNGWRDGAGEGFVAAGGSWRGRCSAVVRRAHLSWRKLAEVRPRKSLVGSCR